MCTPCRTITTPISLPRPRCRRLDQPPQPDQLRHRQRPYRSGRTACMRGASSLAVLGLLHHVLEAAEETLRIVEEPASLALAVRVLHGSRPELAVEVALDQIRQTAARRAVTVEDIANRIIADVASSCARGRSSQSSNPSTRHASHAGSSGSPLATAVRGRRGDCLRAPSSAMSVTPAELRLNELVPSHARPSLPNTFSSPNSFCVPVASPCSPTGRSIRRTLLGLQILNIGLCEIPMAVCEQRTNSTVVDFPRRFEQIHIDGHAHRQGGLSARFLTAVGNEVAAGGLTPNALARGAVQVLDVNAAGLSTVDDVLRLPLGASSEAASVAEGIQASLREGCCEAAELRAPVVLDLDVLAVRWPLYAAELTARTPFRALAVIPLCMPGQKPFATLDLLTTDPVISGRVDPVELDEHIAAPASALLSTCLDQIPDVGLSGAVPHWFHAVTRRRWNVWVAVGMVMGTRPCSTRSALSLLRGCAYSQDRDLDDLAADIVSRRLAITDLMA